MISHWDDGSGMTTILSFELTVASRQRMTVKKEYGSQGRPDVYTGWPDGKRMGLGWHLVALKKSPDQGEEERSQMIGWDPKTEVGTPSRQRK